MGHSHILLHIVGLDILGLIQPGDLVPFFKRRADKSYTFSNFKWFFTSHTTDCTRSSAHNSSKKGSSKLFLVTWQPSLTCRLPFACETTSYNVLATQYSVLTPTEKPSTRQKFHINVHKRYKVIWGNFGKTSGFAS